MDASDAATTEWYCRSCGHAVVPGRARCPECNTPGSGTYYATIKRVLEEISAGIPVPDGVIRKATLFAIGKGHNGRWSKLGITSPEKVKNRTKMAGLLYWFCRRACPEITIHDVSKSSGVPEARIFTAASKIFSACPRSTAPRATPVDIASVISALASNGYANGDHIRRVISTITNCPAYSGSQHPGLCHFTRERCVKEFYSLPCDIFTRGMQKASGARRE